MLLYVTGLTSTSNECIPKNSDLECDPIIRKYGGKKRGLTGYMLTLEEQKKYDYPIKGQFLKGFVWLFWWWWWGFVLILTVSDMVGHTRHVMSFRRERSVSYLCLFILGSPRCKGYIYTECDQQRTDSSPLFGLDCEMVKINACGLTKYSRATRVLPAIPK